MLMNRRLERSRHQLALLTSRLHGCSPTAKLVRGYGYLEQEGRPLHTVKQVQEGDTLRVTVHDGSIQTRVEAVTPLDEEDYMEDV
jgi:exodeoxyribonuclease VII large subunit